MTGPVRTLDAHPVHPVAEQHPGNKDDRFDTYVLADTVRTDRCRLTPLVEDGQASTALRKLCRARKDLVVHRIAVPAAVGLFRKIDSAISRTFLARFTTQDTLDWLSTKQLAAWLASVGYSARTDPAKLYEHLNTAPRGATGDYGRAPADITHAYLATLATITTQIEALTQQITEAFDTHPDKEIFICLPKTGTVNPQKPWTL